MKMGGMVYNDFLEDLLYVVILVVFEVYDI